jgi:hypothetical protein
MNFKKFILDLWVSDLEKSKSLWYVESDQVEIISLYFKKNLLKCFKWLSKEKSLVFCAAFKKSVFLLKI